MNSSDEYSLELNNKGTYDLLCYSKELDGFAGNGAINLTKDELDDMVSYISCKRNFSKDQKNINNRLEDALNEIKNIFNCINNLDEEKIILNMYSSLLSFFSEEMKRVNIANDYIQGIVATLNEMERLYPCIKEVYGKKIRKS